MSTKEIDISAENLEVSTKDIEVPTKKLEEIGRSKSPRRSLQGEDQSLLESDRGFLEDAYAQSVLKLVWAFRPLLQRTFCEGEEHESLTAETKRLWERNNGESSDKDN